MECNFHFQSQGRAPNIFSSGRGEEPEHLKIGIAVPLHSHRGLLVTGGDIQLDEWRTHKGCDAAPANRGAGDATSPADSKWQKKKMMMMMMMMAQKRGGKH